MLSTLFHGSSISFNFLPYICCQIPHILIQIFLVENFGKFQNNFTSALPNNAKQFLGSLFPSVLQNLIFFFTNWPIQLWKLLQNLVFFWIFLYFQWQKSLKKSMSLIYSESKSYQINSIKSCSSRSFQQHQKHIPIPLKILAMILIFSEEIIQYSRTFVPQVQTSWNQSWGTRPRWELSKDTKNVIWSIPVQWISWVQTKQNKQTTFLHR
jgi:hypothetical protein